MSKIKLDNINFDNDDFVVKLDDETSHHHSSNVSNEEETPQTEEHTSETLIDEIEQKIIDEAKLKAQEILEQAQNEIKQKEENLELEKEKLINGKVYDSIGLNKDICDIENGKIEVKETSMLGIEEALNSVTTAKICELITGEYQIKSYGRASRIAELLLQNDELKKLLFRAQFKEDNDWIEYLGEENAKIICENLDTLVNAMYAPWSEVNTPEKRKAYNERLNKLCEETYDFTSEILKSKSGLLI